MQRVQRPREIGGAGKRKRPTMRRHVNQMYKRPQSLFSFDPLKILLLKDTKWAALQAREKKIQKRSIRTLPLQTRVENGIDVKEAEAEGIMEVVDQEGITEETGVGKEMEAGEEVTAAAVVTD